MHPTRLFLLVALVLFFVAPRAAAGDDWREAVPLDRVQLKQGRDLEGTVVLYDRERLILRVGTRDKVIEKEEIDSVKAKMLDLPTALQLHSTLEPGDIERRLQMAIDFKGMGLPLEGRLLLWEVLLIDPENEAAHAGLEHKKSGKRWLVPVGNRWQPLDKAHQIHAKFSDPWEFPTTHFQLRTDIPLAEAVRTAWLLEAAYFSFHELVGTEIGLYQTVEPMDTWVYAQLNDFPNTTSGPGFFSPESRTTYTQYDPASDVVLLHEMVHGMLFAASDLMGGSATIPAWVEEGLAEYLPMAVDRQGNVLRGLSGMTGVSKYHFITHFESDKSYGLKRTLTFSTSDFHADNLQAEKYAAAYALTHYLMHGEGAEHRERFIEFLRGALGGKATSQAFKKVLLIKKIRDFDRAWAEYTKTMATS